MFRKSRRRVRFPVEQRGHCRVVSVVRYVLTLRRKDRSRCHLSIAHRKIGPQPFDFGTRLPVVGQSVSSSSFELHLHPLDLG
jgi:hypothetical protein